MPVQIKRGGRTVTRKATDGYAKLAVKPAMLKALLSEASYEGRPLSIRALSAHCGHKSHQHLMRLVNGQTSTTSEKTATIVEDVLQRQGLLFTRHPARSLSQARTDRDAAKNIPAPRRAA